MIVHVVLGETLEYFIETKKEEFDYVSLTRFLSNRIELGSEYEKTSAEEALVVIALINQQECGFPVIGGQCRGVYRYVMVPAYGNSSEVYDLEISIVDVLQLED